MSFQNALENWNKIREEEKGAWQKVLEELGGLDRETPNLRPENFKLATCHPWNWDVDGHCKLFVDVQSIGVFNPFYIRRVATYTAFVYNDGGYCCVLVDATYFDPTRKVDTR